MKKSASSIFLLSGLAALSLASYLFLATVPADVEGSGFANQKEGTELEGEAPRKVVLPDVALAKRLINITKIVLPRD